MKKIGDQLGKNFERPAPEKKRGGVNSQRADTIEQLMAFMGEDPKDSKRFRYWLGRTRKIESGEIHRLMATAKAEGKKPRALFEYLLKNYGK